MDRVDKAAMIRVHMRRRMVCPMCGLRMCVGCRLAGRSWRLVRWVTGVLVGVGVELVCGVVLVFLLSAWRHRGLWPRAVR